MNKEQQFIIVEWMEKHGDLSHVVKSPQGRLKKQHLWKQLIHILHRVAGGARKNQRDWMKSWTELKLRTKRKCRALSRDHNGTGGGRPKAKKLTETEERVAGIIGGRGIFGSPSQETGLESSNTVPMPASSSSVQEEEVEVLDEDFLNEFRPSISDDTQDEDVPGSPAAQSTCTSLTPDEDLSPRPALQGIWIPCTDEVLSVSSPAHTARSSLTLQDEDLSERPVVRRNRTSHIDEELSTRPAVRRSLITRTDEYPSASPAARNAQSVRRSRTPQENELLPSRPPRRRRPDTPFDRAAVLFAQLEERRLTLDQRRLELEAERGRDMLRIYEVLVQMLSAIQPLIIDYLTRH